jgi:hypothetical protein
LPRPLARPRRHPGAPGLGDRLFPGSGNGGYDALHYDLKLRYATSAPTQPIDGTVTMLARQVVGAATFQRIERTWVQRYRDKSASTADFIALASQVSGRDLSGFLRDWLFRHQDTADAGAPRLDGQPGPEAAPPARTPAPSMPRRR